MNKIQNRITIVRIDKTKSYFFEKDQQNWQTLYYTDREKKNTQITKIRKWKYCHQSYKNKKDCKRIFSRCRKGIWQNPASFPNRNVEKTGNTEEPTQHEKECVYKNPQLTSSSVVKHHLGAWQGFLLPWTACVPPRVMCRNPVPQCDPIEGGKEVQRGHVGRVLGLVSLKEERASCQSGRGFSSEPDCAGPVISDFRLQEL